MIEKIRQFLREFKIEMKKVTWPTRKETISSTMIVIVMVLLISMYLGVVDMVLSRAIAYVLS